MTREQAKRIAEATFLSMVDQLGQEAYDRLKAVDVIPRLHKGMLTMRFYFKNTTAPDPEPYIFTAEEIL